MKSLGSFFRKESPRSLGDNDTFVQLIRLAQEDVSIRERLEQLLSLEPRHREHAVSALVRDMRSHGAPDDFAEAVLALANDEVAQKAAEAIGL